MSGGTPGLGAHTGVVTTARKGEPLPRRATRAVLGFLLLGVLMIACTYVVLATTVFVVMRADGHQVAVLRNTFPIGQAPADVIVYASSEPVDASVAGKAAEAVVGVPAGSVVQIVGGPFAEVATDKDGHITVNGARTDYRGQVSERSLAGEYVAICLAGACETDTAVIVGQNNLIGEVKGYLGLTGLTAPTDATGDRG